MMDDDNCKKLDAVKALAYGEWRNPLLAGKPPLIPLLAWKLDKNQEAG